MATMNTRWCRSLRSMGGSTLLLCCSAVYIYTNRACSSFAHSSCDCACSAVSAGRSRPLAFAHHSCASSSLSPQSHRKGFSKECIRILTLTPTNCWIIVLHVKYLWNRVVQFPHQLAHCTNITESLSHRTNDFLYKNSLHTNTCMCACLIMLL